MRTTSIAALLAALASAAVAQQTQDAGALRLTWNDTGRIARVECAGDDVTSAAVPSSGFALRDCAARKEYNPIACKVTPTDNGLRLAGRNGDGTLALSVECSAEKDWLVVRGTVDNLTDTDRAVSLRFALPVACKGWTWHTRLHKTEPLGPGKAIHLGPATPLGSGHLALRPVAAISDAARTVGLVVPVDHKGQYDFVADPDSGLFSVVLDFAMTKHCPRFHKKVPFAFCVDAEPDGWGLRSVLARYYANRSEFFTRHTPEPGGWFAWGDILRQPAPVCDYGLMFHEQPEAKAGFANDKALGIQVYPYIEPIMYQMCMGDQPADKRPERDFIINRLREWAKPETKGRLPSGGYRTQEALQKICHAILTSGVKDPEGNVVIGGVGQYNWISGTKWAAQFPLNLCPAIPDGAGQDRLQLVREKLLTVPYLSGIYLDSYSAHLHRVNYGQDHLRYISYPPQFDAKTFQPCVLNGFTVWEWTEALWDMLPDDKKELLPNLYGQRVPFPWHRFTVMGKEHWVGATGPLMQQYRTMGYRKVVTQLPAYKDDKDERFLRNLMLLGVFPGGYARRPTDPPLGMRASYRLVIPLLRQLHLLGWEPVTHAKGPAWIERYGSTPGPVCLAVHNPYDAGIIRLAIDAERLGLPEGASVADALDGAPVEFSRTGNVLHAAIGIKGNWTTLLVVGNKEAHARWHRMLAEDRLDDVRLCLKEYALRNKMEAHAAWGAVANLAGKSKLDQLETAAKAISGDAPTEARARELLKVAATHIRNAESPQAVSSRPAVTPQSGVTLPWTETFDTLSPERWAFTHAKQTTGAAAANGRLELELPRDATTAGVRSVEQWPFVPRPLVIEADFKYAHGEHDRYLMFSMKLAPTSSGGEYLLVRVDGSRKDEAQMRVENHNAPPTKWQHTLTEWKPFDASKPHHLRLRLDRETFRLELDGELVGEGPHECSFAWAHLILGVYSGHKGHGDVCWWDNLKLYRAPEER